MSGGDVKQAGRRGKYPRLVEGAVPEHVTMVPELAGKYRLTQSVLNLQLHSQALQKHCRSVRRVFFHFFNGTLQNVF
jgi:hypothetical protein